MAQLPLLRQDLRQPSGGGVDVVNIFNQSGAKGTINGTELVTKDEAKKYAGYIMSGSYLRPFTVEFSASLKF